MKFCKRFQMILTNTQTDIPRMARTRCKQWDCYYCAEKNRKQWRYDLFMYLSQNPHIQWSFHTFTMPKRLHKQKDITGSVKLIKKYWDVLMKRLKRRYGKFEYIRVIELHKSGIPHIHLMAGFHIPEEELSKHKNPRNRYIRWLKKAVNTQELPFGYMINSQNAAGSERQTVSYITKYMTKQDAGLFEIAKLEKLRLILTSRGIKCGKSDNDEIWNLKSHLTAKDFEYFENWLDVNTGELVDASDMIDGAYPPLLDL